MNEELFRYYVELGHNLCYKSFVIKYSLNIFIKRGIYKVEIVGIIGIEESARLFGMPFRFCGQ